MVENSIFYGKEKEPWLHNILVGTPSPEDGFQFYGHCYKCGRLGHTATRCPLIKCRVCRKYVAHKTDCCNHAKKPPVNRKVILQQSQQQNTANNMFHALVSQVKK